MMSVAMDQGSFTVLEAISMDRLITPTFEVPAASFGAVTIVSFLLLLILNDHVLLPIASKIARKSVNPDLMQRMGIGLALSVLAMAALAIVESIRRRLALDGITISAMWLLPYHIVMGFGEGYNVIAQNEFYYLELPRSMSSVAATLFGVGSSLADLGASFLVSMVRKATKRGEEDDSWVSSDINRGHYDYYYWVIVGLSSLNLVYYLACSWGRRRTERDEGVGGDREAEHLAGGGRGVYLG
ncbi:hypothetical protein MLD38_015246 [Melastoma candidum]|nr:hypothetical protein MLD38_015246 [Melastoma candidum]